MTFAEAFAIAHGYRQERLGGSWESQLAVLMADGTPEAEEMVRLVVPASDAAPVTLPTVTVVCDNVWPAA